MTHIIQIGDRIITATEIIPLIINNHMLPQMRRILIINEAIASIQLTPEEEQGAIEQFYHRMTTPAARAAVMKHYGLTEEQLKTNAIQELKLEKFKRETWNSQVESYFINHKSQFDQVIYSLIRTEDGEVAQELYYRIKAGEQSFAKCAKEYSAGIEAQTRGLIGPVPLSQPHPVIAQKLLVSQPGQLWQPMRIENWFIILQLEKLIPALLDEAMRIQIINRLFEAWVAQEMKNIQITVHAQHCEDNNKPHSNLHASNSITPTLAIS